MKRLPKTETSRARSPCRDAFPSGLFAVARRPSGLRVKSHVTQNVHQIKAVHILHIVVEALHVILTMFDGALNVIYIYNVYEFC